MKHLPFALLIVALGAIGCGSSSTDDNSTGTAAPSSPKNSTAPSASPSSASNATPATGYAAVQEVFTANCRCHTNGNPKAGLSLSSYDGVMKGSTEGPVVKAGDPDASVLAQALQGKPGVKSMPPKGRLADDQIKIITDWIKAGAKDG